MLSNARSEPIWAADPTPPPMIPPLQAHTRADVCVIGAGIAGLSVALSVLERGHSVVVVDRRGIGAGETLRTTAHLASAIDEPFTQLEHWHGRDGAQLAVASHAAAVDLIEHWAGQYAIDCDFARVDGYLCDPARRDTTALRRELEAAQRLGLHAEWLAEGPPGLAQLGPALRYARQARVHPRRYLYGLAEAVLRCGGRIFADGEVSSVEAGGAPRAHCSNGTRIDAGAIVVATNAPFQHRLALQSKIAAYRTFVIAGAVSADTVPDALFWDVDDPYHYVRRLGRAGDTDYLIVGGEDRRTGQTPDDAQAPLQALAEWAMRYFPGFRQVDYGWSGQILEPIDGLAYIGQDPGNDNVYVVTADSGNGMTHGTLAGPLLAALIDGQSHPWQALYAPERKRLSGTWLSENANISLQYGDWLSAGDVATAERIDAGQGAVVRHGLHRFAIYRDEAGRLHAYSARCPHLGCSVRWNSLERSWDCPCHGSRFDPLDGRVLNGPAASGLEPVQPD